MNTIRVDVAVIGAGVTGCAIARELSKYQLKVALIDGADDVAMGSSRANSAIVHAGYDCEPGTMMAKMNVEGNALYDQWCRELNVPLQRVGSLVIAFDEADRKELQKLYDKGITNGVPGMRLVDGAGARELEPSLNSEVVGALYAPTGAITCPYELTIACCENAQANGVELLLGRKVEAIEVAPDGLTLTLGDQKLSARYAVNAAGLFADEVARLVGDDSFDIHPRKGEYLLLDKQAGIVRTVVFQTPSKLGKGVLVSPTVDGNCFAGPTAVETGDKLDNEVTEEGIAQLTRLSKRSVPALNLRAVITSFAGVRAQPSTGDFVLRPSEKTGRLLFAAGICSPGLTSAPAIARYMVELLQNQGLEMKQKSDYNPVREPIPAFRHMTDAERREAIRRDSRYGRIICRCETVTEGEIVEAIRRGARTLDGVKRRTRAGMGRCQGGFCSPRVMEILSRELNVPMEQLTKFGGNSKLLVGKLKEEM